MIITNLEFKGQGGR